MSLEGLKCPNKYKMTLRVWIANIHHKLKTPWPEFASELYRPSDRRLSAKLVPTFADRGCHVVSVADPYSHIIGFLDRKQTPYTHYTVEFPFSVPQFEGLPHLRLEKVDNFSISLNLAFISILPQRNIKWGFSCNGVRKENLNILPVCFVCVWNFYIHSTSISTLKAISSCPSNIFVHINTASGNAS
jgi:hypothetical protein